jgi:hypothetical protein
MVLTGQSRRVGLSAVRLIYSPPCAKVGRADHGWGGITKGGPPATFWAA